MKLHYTSTDQYSDLDYVAVNVAVSHRSFKKKLFIPAIGSFFKKF